MSSILEALKQAEKDKYKLLQDHQYNIIKDASKNKYSLLKLKKIFCFLIIITILSLSVLVLPKIKTIFILKNPPWKLSNQKGQKKITIKQKTAPVTQTYQTNAHLSLSSKNKDRDTNILSPSGDKISNQEAKIVATSHNKKGVYYYKQGNFEKAIIEFKSALEADPKYDQVYYNLGIIYDDKGLYNQAIKEYQKALLINPSYEEAYVNMGIIYSHKKLYNKALLSYKKALELNPDDADAHLNIGIIYAYHIIDKNKAIFHWKRYMDLKPTGSQVAELRKEIIKIK